MVLDKSASREPVKLQSRLLLANSVSYCKTIEQKVYKAVRVKYDGATELVTTTSLRYLTMRKSGAEQRGGQW